MLIPITFSYCCHAVKKPFRQIANLKGGMTNFILDAEKHGLCATPRRQQLKSAKGKQSRKLPLCDHKVHGNFLVLSYAMLCRVMMCCASVVPCCAMMCYVFTSLIHQELPRICKPKCFYEEKLSHLLELPYLMRWDKSPTWVVSSHKTPWDGLGILKLTVDRIWLRNKWNATSTWETRGEGCLGYHE